MMRAAGTAAEYACPNTSRTSQGIRIRNSGTATTISPAAAAMYRRTPAMTARSWPCSQSRVCSVSRTSRTGELAAERPACGAWAIRNRPTWVVPATTPSSSGASAVRSDSIPVARLDCTTNDLIGAPVLRERPRRRRREPPKRARPDGRDGGGCHRLGDHDAGDRLPDAVLRADGDREQSEAHRERQIRAAQVVATAEEERGRGDVLGRLDEGEQRRGEDRASQAARPEHGVRERREGGEDDAPEGSSDDLEAERRREQLPQPPPILRGDVAKAEFRQRLLHREVEQRLHEGGRDQRGGVEAELVDPEHARGDDGPEKSQRDGRIQPHGRRGTTPQKP